MSRKRKKLKSPEPARPKPFEQPRRGWLPWLIGLLVLALLAGGAIAMYEWFAPVRIPPEMVGRWKVVGGEWDGDIMEFRRDGTLIIKVIRNGQEGKIVSRVEVEDNTLKLITTNPLTNRTETGSQTILSLTESDFVTVDPNGIKIEMKRLP